MKVRVTERQKRTVECPKCGARRRHPCRSSRIPGANTFGGGWGGPVTLDSAHAERRAAYLETVAPKKLTRDQAIAKLKETRELTTGLLEPLGIAFETWLRFAQLPSERCAELVDQLIAKMEARDA